MTAPAAAPASPPPEKDFASQTPAAAAPVSDLLYIRLSGGDPPGELIGPSSRIDIDAEIAVAADGVRDLIAGYLDERQGYPARAGQEAWNRKGDYDHLSRWREWGQGSDTSTDSGDGE